MRGRLIDIFCPLYPYRAMLCDKGWSRRTARCALCFDQVFLRRVDGIDTCNYTPAKAACEVPFFFSPFGPSHLTRGPSLAPTPPFPSLCSAETPSSSVSIFPSKTNPCHPSRRRPKAHFVRHGNASERPRARARLRLRQGGTSTVIPRLHLVHVACSM